MDAVLDAADEGEAAETTEEETGKVGQDADPVGLDAGTSDQAANATARIKSMAAPSASASGQEAGSAERGAGVAVQETGSQEEAGSGLAAQDALADGVYVMVTALDKGKAVDVPGGSHANGTSMQIYSSNHTPAQRWRIAQDGNGRYEIVNIESDLALDVAGAWVGDGATVQQYERNSTLAQRWNIIAQSGGSYRIESALDKNYVLDVSAASTANGTRVQLWSSNGTKAQRWVLTQMVPTVADGVYTVKGAGSGKVLDIAGGSLENGGNLQQWTANSSEAQAFGFTYDPDDGYYSLTVARSGMVVDVAGGWGASGANVQQYEYNKTNAQKWAIEKNSDGTYTLFSGVSGLALDVSAGSKADGANVQVWEGNGTPAQKWKLAGCPDWLPEGKYSFASALNPNLALDVSGASQDDGANVQMWTSNGTTAQEWYVLKSEGGAYAIANASSGKYLGSEAKRSESNVSVSSSEHLWVPLLTPEGIELRVKGNTGLALDVAGGSRKSGANVWVYTANGSKAQRFLLEKIESDVVYDSLRITLRQMAEYQLQSAYNSDYTVEELMDLLDPGKLNETCFADLRVGTGVTGDQLDAFIVSTSTGRSGMLVGLGSAFAQAAAEQGLNEVYLLAHAILESGWGTSTLARGYDYEGGTVDGEQHEEGTYYNFYGIGAYDDSPLSGGRKLAIQNDWDTPAKAVTGAAEWIADNYIYASLYAQPTLYAMKWDYARSNATYDRGWHQYATGTSWPESIARIMDQCYDFLEAAGPTDYVVPQYA